MYSSMAYEDNYCYWCNGRTHCTWICQRCVDAGKFHALMDFCKRQGVSVDTVAPPRLSSNAAIPDVLLAFTPFRVGIPVDEGL